MILISLSGIGGLIERDGLCGTDLVILMFETRNQMEFDEIYDWIWCLCCNAVKCDSYQFLA